MRGGGAERVMAILTDELAKRGHEVTLVTMITEQPFYILNKRIKLRQRRNRRGNSFMARIIHRLNTYFFIRKMIKSENPSVVISFMWHLNSIVLTSTVFLKVPIIASEHSAFDIELPFIKRIKKFHVNKLADKVTVLTEHDFEFMKDRLKNVYLMPNPLAFKPIEKYNAQRQKNIIAVGNIDRFIGKGFDSLIKIWSEIAFLYPDWKLQIAGKGTLQNIKNLQNIAKQYHVSKQFELIGQIQNLALKFRESTIFILSSKYEGFGMVLIEAMSQGCACISYDCKTGPREIITHNVDGILVDDQNMEAMKNAISDLIENSEKRTFLAENAIKSVKRFSVKKIVDKWEMLLNEVITK